MTNSTANDPTPGLADVFRQPAARSYLFIGLAALIVYYSQMFEPYGDLGTLLAVVIALPGLAARWVISPPLFLMITTYLIYDPKFNSLQISLYGPGPGRYPRVTELGLLEMLLLAASVLTYLIAQFRLLSLAHQSMPDDPPPRRKGQPEPTIPRRPPSLFADREIVLMFWLVPICVLAGRFIWLAIFQYENGGHLGRTWGIEQPFARFILFAWIFITGAIVANVALRYLALRRMSRLQARLLLQDMFWQETRREQERIYRWRRWQRQRQPDVPTDLARD